MIVCTRNLNWLGLMLGVGKQGCQQYSHNSGLYIISSSCGPP